MGAAFFYGFRKARFERSRYQHPRAHSPLGSADLPEVLSVFGTTCE